VTDLASLRPWLELREVPGLGDRAISRLVREFGSPAALFQVPLAELMSRGELGRRTAEAVLIRRDGDAAKRIDGELRAIERQRITILTCMDPGYPARLLTIPDPPPLLYLRGSLAEADRQAVAVVGSRRASPAGRAVTEQLARELAGLGFTVVSGLARGVDAAAHRGALAAGGRTLAVLGCGIDQTYPPEHKKLRETIESHGAVLSECPMGAPPHPHHFPKRNRIISGLSMGVVVTEAAHESGSLITARLAAEQGREVFAVPGPVTSECSRGPHGLIRQGAALVERVDDIVEELLPQLDDAMRDRLKNRKAEPIPSQRTLDPLESRIVAQLSFDPLHIDDLVERTGLTAAEVQTAMLTLEFAGRVRQLPGHLFVRAR
jgi:DNA processing protein